MIDFRYSGFVGMSAAVLLMAACTNDEAIRNITPEEGSEKTAVVKFAFQVEMNKLRFRSILPSSTTLSPFISDRLVI